MVAITHHRLTRKQFLLYILGIVIALSGVKAILNVLNPKPQQTSGFGAGPYGGK